MEGTGGLQAAPKITVLTTRGYKYIFLQEAKTIFGDAFSDSRLHLNTTVRSIDYSAFASELTDTADDTSGTSIGLDKAIKVTTDQGDFYARHVISTLSVGVLQHQDVKWVPSLPPWKKEAIFSFSMATYQKIFMLFPEQFWGDTEVRSHLYLRLEGSVGTSRTWRRVADLMRRDCTPKYAALVISEDGRLWNEPRRCLPFPDYPLC